MINQVIKHQIQAKIDFLESQLESLNHYLPETYEYLMHELDLQKCALVELEVADAFAFIESESNRT